MPNHKLYSLAELSRQAHLPRSTVRYYETIGIISELDSQSIYRFTDEDLRRLDSAVFLRNLGYEPKVICNFINDDPLSVEHLKVYQAKLKQNNRFITAQITCLGRFIRLVEQKDDIWTEKVEPYILARHAPAWRANEFRYYDEKTWQFPIISGAAWVDGQYYDQPNQLYISSAVAQQYVDLVDGFSDDMDIIGNSYCICGVFTCPVSPQPLLDNTTECFNAFKQLAAYADDLHYSVMGNGFIPYSFASGETTYCYICLPISNCT